jgi:poly(3-hydroxybutyrate) depolymerase
VPQRHDELADEQAALDAQMTELHQCKATQGTERAVTVNYTKARARARANVVTINREGMPHATFLRASQNVGAAVALLDTLPTPSIDRASKVNQQLKDILRIVAEQQAESSLQRWAEASVSSPSRSKAS